MRTVGSLGLAALALAGLASFGARVNAAEDVRDLRAALSHEADAERRIAILPRIAAIGGASAAATLAEVVATDPDVAVRAAAAKALGRTDAENAVPLLLVRAKEGGPRLARAAVARALSDRNGAGAQLLEVVADPKTPEAERVLLLRALGSFADAASRAALVAASRSEAPATRDAAARALAARRDAKGECLAALLRVLNEAKDREAILSALDAVEPAVDAAMRPILDRILKSTDPYEREAARHLVECLARAEAAEAGKGASKPAGDRYARPADDVGDPKSGDPDPSPRARYDIVYAIDSTGSTATTLAALRKRIVEEMALLLRLGASVRVGVVAYRGGHGVDARKNMDVLLPAFDPDRVAAFLEALRPGGVDERGAAVSQALVEALDRTPWRWDARRDAHLLADGPCDDPASAVATVAVHFKGDDTRTSVVYVARTRTKVPPEFADLAKAGGTGAAEVLK